MGARAMTHLVPPIALSVGIVKTSRSDAHGGSTERASRTAKRGHSSPFRDRTKAALTVSRIWHFQGAHPATRVFPRVSRDRAQRTARGVLGWRDVRRR